LGAPVGASAQGSADLPLGELTDDMKPAPAVVDGETAQRGDVQQALDRLGAFHVPKIRPDKLRGASVISHGGDAPTVAGQQA
jgi:hypothetical protein